MGRVALPEMRARGYEDRLATGCIAAGGTLGMLIPPSAIMVIYAVLADTSINKMFIAAIVPAIVATLFYMAVVFVRIRLSPSLAPRGEAASGSELLRAFLRSWSVLILFGIVVGGIYGGIFTATEAAAVGAGTAFLFAWVRKGLTAGALWRVLEETASSTGMLYMIVIGAMAFAFFIGVTQLPNDLVAWTTGLDLAPVLVVLAILLLYIFLGAFMDPITMLLITVPVVLPLIRGFEYDLALVGHHDGNGHRNRHDYAAAGAQRLCDQEHFRRHTADGRVSRHRAVPFGRHSAPVVVSGRAGVDPMAAGYDEVACGRTEMSVSGYKRTYWAAVRSAFPKKSM